MKAFSQLLTIADVSLTGSRFNRTVGAGNVESPETPRPEIIQLYLRWRIRTSQGRVPGNEKCTAPTAGRWWAELQLLYRVKFELVFSASDVKWINRVGPSI